MTLKKNIKTAIREPYKIPPWLAARSTGPARWAEYRAKTALLETQRLKLDWLRGFDDWLLIVLDACRYDVFADLFDEFFDGEVDCVHSAGHDTFEYVRKCWPDTYEMPYVSGATPINSAKRGYEDEHIDQLYDGYVPADHLNIVDAWDFGWDDSLGTCPPWSVTDAALERTNHDRLVAHYFQPHAPYIGEKRFLGHTDNKHASPHDGVPVDKPIWKSVKRGVVSDDKLRRAYRTNLVVVLKEVSRLVDETDFERVYIMGDHGEALGEWQVYSHPRTPHAKIRTVPWAEVTGLTAAGREAAEASNIDETKSGEADGAVQERLEVLGYV